MAVKITSKTTLGELAIAFAQHGVTSCTLASIGTRRRCVLMTSTETASGSGDIEHEAIAMAFDMLMDGIAARLGAEKLGASVVTLTKTGVK